MPLSDDDLTDHERTLLTFFLGERADKELGMTASMADGFLTAVVSHPRDFSPEEWLGQIASLDGLPAVTNGFKLNAEDALTLILRRHHEIARALATNDVDMLLSAPDEDEGDNGGRLLFGEMWCYGYLNGISLDASAWDPLLADPEHATALDDIYFLATPFIAKNAAGLIDPAMAEAYESFGLLTAQERSDIAQELPDAVLEIYRYWRRTLQS